MCSYLRAVLDHDVILADLDERGTPVQQDALLDLLAGVVLALAYRKAGGN